MRRASCLLIAVAGLGCQTSYLVGRGDAALDRGDPARAVSDYLAALERRTSAGSKEEIRHQLERAALALANEEIESARTLAASGQTEEARLLLWRILVADVWGAASAKDAVLDALEAIDRPAWAKIEALATGARFVPALREANRLAAPYPERHPMRARLADLSRRGQQHHLERAAKSSEKAVAWLHQRIAMSLGADRPLDHPELERAIAAGAAYAWRVRIDADGCPRLAKLIEERLAKSEQRGPIAELDFERCRESERSWSEQEQRAYSDRVPTVRFVEEPYWSEELDPACDPEGCLRYDELGVCLQRPAPPSTCGERKRKLAVRQVPVIQYEPIEREMKVEVLRRQIEVEASGQIRFEGEEPVPFEAKETFDDRAFWSPAESRRFGSTDASRIVEKTFAKLEQALDRRVAEVRAERAIAASGSKDAERGERAESLHVLAVAVSRTVPDPAKEHFASSYGMSEADVLSVFGHGGKLFAAVQPPSRRELPPADLDPELDHFEHAAVARKSDVPGLALLAETGFDLAFTGGSTALATADRVYGFEARVRVGGLLVTASGQSGALAGDVGGFSLSMTGLTLDLAKAGFFFGWGLGYAQQRTDEGEQYRIFTIPLILRLPILSWLWVGASFEPNLLFTKTIFDDDEGDPHFWSPIRAWAVFDLEQRVFLRAGAAHYLGAGFGRRPVQAELMLGVRL